MNTNHTRTTRACSFSLVPAAVLLASLAGSAAQAQVTPLTAPPAGQFATTTSTYPLGDPNNSYITGPFTVAAGSNNVTFTATDPGSVSFESFTNFDDSLAFPTNTVAVDTFDDADPIHHPTGPLEISFSSPVSAFGLTVESARVDTATFSFMAYDGAVASQNLIGTFTYAPVTQTADSPQSIFIGGQAAGDQIVNIVVSDTSIATKNGVTSTAGTNDFYFGPLSTFAPVPEASTTISFGLLLMLGFGGVLIRRKANAPKKATD